MPCGLYSETLSNECFEESFREFLCRKAIVWRRPVELWRVSGESLPRDLRHFQRKKYPPDGILT